MFLQAETFPVAVQLTGRPIQLEISKPKA